MEYVRGLLNASTIVLHRWLKRQYTLIGLARGKPGRYGCAIGPWAGPACGPALADRRMRRQIFEPHLVIMVQATLIVVDEHAGRNMLRIYKGQSPVLAENENPFENSPLRTNSTFGLLGLTS